MVKLRLKRTGKKKQPSYQIVAIDARKKRDGSYLEKVGHFFPLEHRYDLDQAKVLKWLKLGAQPTKTVLTILIKEKIMTLFQKGKANQNVKKKEVKSDIKESKQPKTKK